MPIGERPPDPDHVAPRGTDAYRDAVIQLHKWVSRNLARGTPMEEVVDKYDDFGNISHDWKEWNNWGGGYHRPVEWDEEMWNIGNFQRQAAAGDFVEWPPGSGIYFNDPANDSSARQFRNQYGDIVGQPAGFDIPEIDYDAVNSGYGGSIRKYLEDETAHGKNKAKAKPGETVYNKPANDAGDNMQQPMAAAQATAKAPGATNTHGAWGVTNFTVNKSARPGSSYSPQNGMMAQPMAGPKPINPFQGAMGSRRNSFSQPQGYQSWRR
jgi:hypothetical protein